MYSRDSVDRLKERVDLVEVLSSHIELKRAGASFKALCPFHDERSPSFIVHKGAQHWHCFGCGAHGDSIRFLMDHLGLGFLEAIEHLADRYGVTLEKTAADSVQDKRKSEAKRALQLASDLYHFALLHTEEARPALHYLFERGIDLDFIRTFRIGFAPKAGIGKALGTTRQVLQEAGFIELFADRIMFPIQDGMGRVIGFSGRKYREETFGGKYVNSPETALFKKNQVLYGLSYSRRRIAKEQAALIVEGQIDALRLIHEGFDYTVASQGTAFTAGHADQLVKLGVKRVYLAFDGDTAGREAATKVGDLFMARDVEVFVVRLPQGLDPDSFLIEKGPKLFQELILAAEGYLAFLVGQADVSSPAAKTQAVDGLIKQIRSWPNPLLVHESLKQLAQLLQLPEETLGLKAGQVVGLQIKRARLPDGLHVDPIKVLESDLIRWLLLLGFERKELKQIITNNLSKDDLLHPACREIFGICQELEVVDLLSVASRISGPEALELLSGILDKKVNEQRLEVGLKESVLKILERNWQLRCEEIRVKIQSLSHDHDQVMALAKEYADLSKKRPVVI